MNILLTGEIQTGKSTVIRKVTEKHPDWKIGGFITVKAPEGGKAPENWPDGQEFLPDAVYVRPAGAHSNGCKSLIRPIAGRI